MTGGGAADRARLRLFGGDVVNGVTMLLASLKMMTFVDIIPGATGFPPAIFSSPRRAMGTPEMTTPAPVGRILRLAATNLRRDIDEFVEATMHAIEQTIPEYARPADETYRRTIRAGIEQALHGFLGILEKRDDTPWRDLYRAIGAGEMREGRSLDALQAAIRIGARVGLRHLVNFAEAQSLTP